MLSTIVFIGLLCIALISTHYDDLHNKGRIRKAVKRAGGEVLSITRPIQFIGGAIHHANLEGAVYKVTHRNNLGEVGTTICRIANNGKMDWESDRLILSNVADGGKEYLEPATEPPPSRACGGCGIDLRPGRDSCHWCGWEKASAGKQGQTA